MRILLGLLVLFRPYWGWMALGLFVSLATLAANIALMAVSGWFIAAMAIAGAAAGTMDYFTPAAIIRFCAIIRTGGRYAERLVTHEATFRLLASLRVWLYHRLEPQSPLKLGLFHSADLAQRLRADIDRLETVYLRIALPVAAALMAVPILIVILGLRAPSFAIVGGVGLVFSGLLVPLLVTRLGLRLGRDQVDLSASLAEHTVETIQGMAELVAMGAADRHLAEAERRSQALIAVQSRLSRLNGLTQAGLLLGAGLSGWGILILAMPLVQAGNLDGAGMVMLILFTMAAFEAVMPLPGAFQALGAALESAKRLFDLADQAPAPVLAVSLEPPHHPDIRAEGLEFGFSSRTGMVFSGLSFHLPPGGKMAVVGPTGTGKSTLVALLTALLEPTAGCIQLAGRSVGEYAPDAVRACFAVAPQTPGLFTGSIRENLLMADPHADEGAMWHALSIARLDEFVLSLPDGLDTPIGEAGTTLSGGQARRLCVARAMLKPAPILVLDEPGEGLDYDTEQEMLKSVLSALDGRSLILITHRRAGLDEMDQIIRLGGI